MYGEHTDQSQQKAKHLLSLGAAGTELQNVIVAGMAILWKAQAAVVILEAIHLLLDAQSAASLQMGANCPHIAIGVVTSGR